MNRTYPWGDPPAGVYDTDGPVYSITFVMEGKTFEVQPINDCGANTGRRRFCVRCITTRTVLHAGTTSPRLIIDRYLDGDPFEGPNVTIGYLPLREQLAAYAHEAWSHWMKYLFSKATLTAAEGGFDEGAFIPNELVKRWQRQLETPYDALPESEKESDRAEADKILAIVSPSSPTSSKETK
jgi:hypothetical protein